MGAAATLAYVDERTTVCGLAVRYLVGGTGDPVVTLHHSTGSIGWLPLHDRLAEEFRVVVPDMPGYGQSERPEWARTPRDLAILVNAGLEQLGLERVALVGFGFGGFVAAELATMDPSRVGRLVLVGAAGIKPRDGHGEIMDMMLMDFVEYMEAGFRDQDAFHAMFGPEVAKDIKQLWDYSREMTARVSWKPYLFSRQLPHLLRAVRAPTLLVWGGADRVIPIDAAYQYRDALPDARLEVIAGAGHYVEYEEPETVARLIVGHIRGA